MSEICKNWSTWLAKTRFSYMNEVQKEQTLNWLMLVRNQVLDLAQLKEGQKIADFGCGSGLLGFRILERFEDKVELIFSDKFQDCLDDCKKILDASGVKEDMLDEYVERLYTEILGRPSEPEGKEYWKKVIIEGKDDNGNIYDAATAARRGFFESTEYKNKGRNDDEFLKDLYHAFFGREPDEAGYADWQNRMKNQGYSRQRVIDEGNN